MSEIYKSISIYWSSIQRSFRHIHDQYQLRRAINYFLWRHKCAAPLSAKGYISTGAVVPRR